MTQLRITFESIEKDTISLFKAEEGERDGKEYLMHIEGDWQVEQQPEQDSEFIVIVDRSGSMMGQPWKQVQEALLKLNTMLQNQERMSMTTLHYNDSVGTLSLGKGEAKDRESVEKVRASGSTDFVRVFEYLGEMFEKKSPEENRKTFLIFFMTDGCDTCNSKGNIMLAKEQMQSKLEKFGCEVVFHVLGFSDSHDDEFLQSLTLLGTSDGSYSFVSPRDGIAELEKTLINTVELTSAMVGRTVNIHMKGPDVAYLGDWFGVSSHDVVLPAFLVKQDQSTKIATTKFVKVYSTDPTMDIKVLKSLVTDSTGINAESVTQFRELSEEEDIKEYSLKKIRAGLGLLTSKVGEEGVSMEIIKSHHNMLKESLGNVEIGENSSPKLKTLHKSVSESMSIIDDILDEKRSETERCKYSKGAVSRHKMKNRMMMPPAQQKRRSNKWTGETTAKRSDLQMKQTVTDYTMQDFEDRMAKTAKK